MSVEVTCESDSSEINFPEKHRRVVLFSSSKDENEKFEEWHDPRSNQPTITPFTYPSGFRIEGLNVKSCAILKNSYELFVPNKLFEDIANRTYMHRKN